MLGYSKSGRKISAAYAVTSKILFKMKVKKNDGFLVKPFYFGTTLMAVKKFFFNSIKNYKVLINSLHLFLS